MWDSNAGGAGKTERCLLPFPGPIDLFAIQKTLRIFTLPWKLSAHASNNEVKLNVFNASGKFLVAKLQLVKLGTKFIHYLSNNLRDVNTLNQGSQAPC